MLLYVANWPAKRRVAWSALLRARAIENLCYVVGVNRIGKDGNGVSYGGDSAAVDFQGQALGGDHGGGDFVETVVLDREALENFRRKFPAHLDADEFEVEEKLIEKQADGSFLVDATVEVDEFQKAFSSFAVPLA